MDYSYCVVVSWVNAAKNSLLIVLGSLMPDAGLRGSIRLRTSRRFSIETISRECEVGGGGVVCPLCLRCRASCLDVSSL